MKKIKSIWTVLFTLVLLCALSAVAYANSLPALAEPSSLVAFSQAVDDPTKPPPGTVETVPESSMSESIPVQTEADETEEAEEQSTPAQGKGNSPYYVGAVFAVLLFIGVALYCKFKGNGNR